MHWNLLVSFTKKRIFSFLTKKNPLWLKSFSSGTDFPIYRPEIPTMPYPAGRWKWQQSQNFIGHLIKLVYGLDLIVLLVGWFLQGTNQTAFISQLWTLLHSSIHIASPLAAVDLCVIECRDWVEGRKRFEFAI